jgi:hypothetical protein
VGTLYLIRRKASSPLYFSSSSSVSRTCSNMQAVERQAIIN